MREASRQDHTVAHDRAYKWSTASVLSITLLVVVCLCLLGLFTWYLHRRTKKQKADKEVDPTLWEKDVTFFSRDLQILQRKHHVLGKNIVDRLRAI